MSSNADNTTKLARQDYLVSWFIGLAFLALYLLLPIRVVNYDAIAYANEVLSPNSLYWFHPHHLLYTRTVWVLYQVLGIIVPHPDMIWFMAALNSITGALGLVFFGRICRLLSGHRLVNALMTLALGLSLGYYQYSAMGEVVMPVIAILLALVYAILNWDLGEKRNVVFLGLMYGIAVLYHQNALLYMPVVLVLLLSRLNRDGRFGRVLVFLGMGLGLVVTAYLVVICAVRGLLNPCAWVQFFVTDINAGLWGKGTLADLGGAMNYLFSTANWGFLVMEPRGDEVFWRFILTWQIWGLVALATVALVKAIWQRRWVFLVVLLNLLMVTIFFTWWEYQCFDFWVLPYIIILFLAVAGTRLVRTNLVVVWLLFLIPAQFAYNWVTQFSFLTDVSSDVNRRAVNALSRTETGNNRVLISENPYQIEWATYYGLDAYFWIQFEMKANIKFLEERIGSLSGAGDIYIQDSIWRRFDDETLPLLNRQQKETWQRAFAGATTVIDFNNRMGHRARILLLEFDNR